MVPSRSATHEEALWERWGEPPRIRQPAGHILLFADRELTREVIRRLVSWLRQPPA